MSQVRDQDERQVRVAAQDELVPYCENLDPAPLLSADRSRPLTPRELVYLLLRGNVDLEWVHAYARRDLPQAAR